MAECRTMNKKTTSIADRQSRVHPLFVKLFLTADTDEDREDSEKRKPAGRRQKRVIRNS
jgi:hypothetical protein